MNPHQLGWGFAGSFPFALASVGVTALAMVFSPRDVRWPRSSAVTVLLCLIAWMGITTLSALHFDASLEKYIDVLKVLGMTIVVASLVRTREEILGLVWVSIMSIGYFGIKGGIFTLRTAGAFHVWGPPNSLVNGNNELAVALIICIPMMYFMMQQAGSLAGHPRIERLSEKWVRRGLLFSMVLCAVSALGSQSRGALLGMAAMAMMMWWRSKAKSSIGIVLVLLVPVLLFFMPDEWWARMSTIQTYEQDQSAMGRINAWQMAINIANDRIFGAGLVTATPYVYGLYAPNPSIVLVAHSIYFQILGEHGYIRLGLYLLFWWRTYVTAGRIVKATKDEPDLEWAGQLASMAKVSLVGYAVGAAFLSLAYWDMPFYIMVALVATDLLVKRELKARSGARKQAVQGVGSPRGHQKQAASTSC